MTTATLRRRTFGPLLYTTLSLAVVITAGVGLWTGSVRLKTAASQGYVPAPDEEAEALAGTLAGAAADAHAWAVAASRLAGVLLQPVSGDEAAGPRGRALAALRRALRDGDPEVAAAAAQALGSLWQHGRSAAGDLEAALTSDDQTLQLAAARALIRIGGDTRRPLATLAALAADPALVPRRSDVVAALIAAGPAGADVAVDLLGRMLADPDEDVRLQVADLLPSIAPEAGRLRPKLHALLDSPDPAVRYSAAMALLGFKGPNLDPNSPSDPRVLAALESTVLDASRPFHLREQTLGCLQGLSPASVRRCGLGLSRQLDGPNYDARFAAATLLQTITPEILAGPPGPVPAR